MESRPRLGGLQLKTPVNYQSALSYLYARTTGGIKPGLERTHALLERMGNPHHRFKSLHVAGTNGKGSTVATAEALLSAQGLKVGKYTSPHLVDFRERIVVGGEQIPEQSVVDFIVQWTPIAEEIGATFFELTTALAFQYFADQHVDIALIETGLGGRLDSTNVLLPLAAAVTSIGLDHQEYLGNTIEEIAAEKAGIFKAGVPAVIGDTGSTSGLLQTIARSVGAKPVVMVGEEWAVTDVRVSAQGTSFKTRGIEIRTGLVGSFQPQNTVTAFALLEAAGFPLDLAKASSALSNLQLLGRFQRVGNVIYDVAHNPEGGQALAANLAAVVPPRPLYAVLCVLADKDWRGIIDALSGVVDTFVITNAPSAPEGRIWRIEEAHKYVQEKGLQGVIETDLHTAVELAKAKAKTVVVTGSFHTVGDSWIKQDGCREV